MKDYTNKISPDVEFFQSKPISEIELETGNQIFNTNSIQKKEKWNDTLLQILIPFIVAGFGMVAAGFLFDKVQKWDLFLNLKEVIVLVPALLGLKGNLEMTLASRLSTHVNLNQVNDRDTIKKVVIGNMALTSLQSIVVGLIAASFASLAELISGNTIHLENVMILIVTSISTAVLASLILGLIIMFIILISAKFKINPDNIATPIAASLGDLVTLAILSSIGSVFYIYRDLIYIHWTIVSFFLFLIPFLAKYCNSNHFVNETLYKGWSPIISAMVISSIAGIILEVAINIYSGVAIYQPVVNGVGGNLVAIFASRLGTSLHKTGNKGKWAHWAPKKYYQYLYHAFLSAKSKLFILIQIKNSPILNFLDPEHETGLVLIGLTLPGHILFFFAIYLLKSQNLSIQLVFFYLGFCFIQVFLLFKNLVDIKLFTQINIKVFILLILCYFMVHLFWRLNQNPDIMSIPFLTAIGDFLGVCLLFLCFHLVYLTGINDLRNTTTNYVTTYFLENSTNLQI